LKNPLKLLKNMALSIVELAKNIVTGFSAERKEAARLKELVASLQNSNGELTSQLKESTGMNAELKAELVAKCAEIEATLAVLESVNFTPVVDSMAIAAIESTKVKTAGTVLEESLTIGQSENTPVEVAVKVVEGIVEQSGEPTAVKEIAEHTTEVLVAEDVAIETAIAEDAEQVAGA
jgi:Fe-S cluster assembly iron-binding protein IscA